MSTFGSGIQIFRLLFRQASVTEKEKLATFLGAYSVMIIDSFITSDYSSIHNTYVGWNFALAAYLSIHS